ncbi:MAG: GspH/FimT family pseudopilin [Hyphomicrobiaceae bacterium]|nr:GspH/FimT family pseudopilin [Hyphomicrobiaceae bacterium]
MTGAGGDRTAGAAAGFTLLEMLVVLAILALASVVVIPSVSPSRADLALKASALGLSAQMRSARSAAVDRNVEHAVVVDLKHKLYWVEGSAMARRIAPRLALSADMRPQDVVGPATVRFRFHPDGTSSGGALVLREGSRAARVAIDWRTGAPRIEWSR